MQTSPSRENWRWATTYKDITTVIRRPEKTCQKKYDRKSGYEPWPKLRAVGSPSYEASQLIKKFLN